ncbi:MAG: anti-sigma factor [Gemmatimonadaceae bacterium]
MTTTGMEHEQALQALEALALDALDADERVAVLAHVASCAICQQEVLSLQDTAAQLAYAVRPVSMSSAQRDRIRTRLVGRVVADRAHTAEVHPSANSVILVPHPATAAHAGRHWLESRASWLAMAATLVAAVSLATLYQVTKERDSIRVQYQAISERTGPVDSLRVALDDRNRLIANLTGPQVAVVTLTSEGIRAPSARMFWDQSVNAWTFVAHNLPAPKTGRIYQIWLVTAKDKINAGTFSPNANGDAVVRATYNLPKDALAAVAVTDEPTAGSPQPTTTPIIVGANSTR